MDDLPAIGGATRTPSPPVREAQPSGDGLLRPKSEETARRAEPVGMRTVQSVDIDPATKSIVFRLTSETTGFVIAQSPSEVQLRVREYVANADATAKWESPNGRKA